MKRILLFLTIYNIVFVLLRILFVVYDPQNTLLKTLQFYDMAVYALFPVFVMWSLLYFTIPTAIYYSVGSTMTNSNRFNLSTLTVNSFACVALILIVTVLGINY